MTRTMYALLSALLLSLTPTICAAQDEPKAAETPAAPVKDAPPKDASKAPATNDDAKAPPTAAPAKQEAPGAACGFDKLPGIPVVISSEELSYDWKDAQMSSAKGTKLHNTKAIVSPKLVLKEGKPCPSYETTCTREKERYVEMTTADCQVFYSRFSLSGAEYETVTVKTLSTFHSELKVIYPEGLSALPVTAPLSQLRSREGVCVGGNTMTAPEGAEDMGLDVELTVCFRVGKSGSADDDKKPRSWVEMRGLKFMVWPGAWLVNIKRDGKDWLKRARPRTSATLSRCSKYGCYYVNSPFLTQNKAFKPGTYDITFTYADNTKRKHTFRIVLLDDKQPKGDEKKPKDGKKK